MQNLEAPKTLINFSVFLLLLIFPLLAWSQEERPTLITTAEYMYLMPSIQQRLDDGTFLKAEAIDKEVNPRRGNIGSIDTQNALPANGDPLAKSNSLNSQSASTKAPSLAFDALSNAGSSPTDPTGAVGPSHYVNAFNSGFQIYDRTGTPLTQPASLANIWPNESLGDPIVLYDRYADRWFIAQFSRTPNSLLVAYSQGSNPLTSGWFTYRFNTSSFPDYPKFSIWSDGIYVTANKDQGSPSTNNVVFAIERNDMIAGAAQANVQMIGFPLPGISNNGFYSPLAFHADGAGGLPPVGVNNFIAYMQDDAWFGVAADHIKLWQIDVDWGTPANSTISAIPIQLNTAPFDGVFDGGSFSNLPQGAGSDIDALQATMMYMMPYYRFGTHNSVLMNWVVDLDGNDDLAGIRWVELRQTADGQPWSIFQEGTHTLNDGVSRFCGSLAMDIEGNIGMAYTVISTTTFPALRYSGRYAADPLGQMTVPEQEHSTGTSIDPSSRYGDYAQLVLDPTDDKQFWHIGEYFKGNSRFNGVGVFNLACVEDLFVAVDASSGQIDHREASNSIIANNTINSGAEADYHAGNSVQLVDGFTAFEGSIFRAHIEGCLDGSSDSRPAISNNFIETPEITKPFVVTDIEMFPNPTSSFITVSLGDYELDDFTVQVYNTSSGMIYTNRFEKEQAASFQLDVSDYPAGIYIILVSDNKNMLTGRVIKN